MKEKKIPAFRKLRCYAFDPALSLQLDTVEINTMEYTLPWEDLDPGPVGEYLEIIDFDPTLKKFYRPVNLNDRHILVENGLRPSESNPQFHQQMVYAVAMTTIKNFEKALGRKIIWSTRLLADRKEYEEYVEKLRIYPHALREANAYYSPHKKAILFGYFASSPANIALHMPNSLVFTCVSHDIIAHEVTHAILDGLYRHYNNPTNPDVLAFHEAFADIVALFQHFTFPDVLKHQIARTRGNLEDQNLLGQLAQEFGSAIGSYGSLRDALGGVNPKTKKWEPKHPDPHEYRTTMEPHARGSILVAAVFEAFINIYKRRISDLLRIASNGTGILPAGELHPDLVNRLAKEAAKSAGHVLSMCIRALDYCPPVDITFGDYLRAIITADSDLVKNDKRDYRLVFIDAFRKRGIYPQGLKTLSVDSLRQSLLNIGYEAPDKKKPKIKALTFSKSHLPEKLDDTTRELIGIIITFLKDYGDKIKYVNDRKAIYDLTRAFIGGKYDDPDELIQGLHQRIQIKFSRSIEFSRITGLAFLADFQRLGLRGNYDYGMPSFQIQNLRMVSRVGPDGNQINQVVFSIFQRSGIIMKNGKPDGHYIPEDDQDPPENGFELQGGCTLIFDLDTEKLKYVISKPLLDLQAMSQKSPQYKIHEERAIRQYNFQFDEGMDHRNEYNKYFGIGLDNKFNEPFAILHKH